MRFDINLASHPYQEEQQLYRRWVPGLIALGIATLLFAGYAGYVWYSGSTVASETAEMQDQIDALEKQRTEAMNILNDSKNRDVRLRAQVLNQLIARKAFSWTRVFSALEKIMPSRAHLISIEPFINPEQKVEIRMRVQSNSRDKALDLLKEMEGSEEFLKPRIANETVADQGVEFEIYALYQAPEPKKDDATAAATQQANNADVNKSEQEAKR